MRFGEDIEEAARRIRDLITQQERAKRQAARISAAADKLRATGWRASSPAVEPGPTLADAQAAIEAGMERDDRLAAEAARRLAQGDFQLAQGGEADNDPPLPPELPERKIQQLVAPRMARHTIEDEIFDRLAFENTSKWEGLRNRVYYDPKGVPTIGYGYALVVDGNNGWTVRDQQYLDDVEIQLTSGDRQRLEQVAQALQNNRRASEADRLSAANQAAPDQDYEVVLSDDAARRTFELTIPEYKRYVLSAVAPYNFDRLHPAQQAVLFDLAYRRPASLLNHSGELRNAMEIDFGKNNWNKTIELLEQIAPGPDERDFSNIAEFRNPTAEFVYQVEPGDSIERVAAKVGMTKAEFLARYPQYAGGTILAGERISFDSPVGRRRSGRMP